MAFLYDRAPLISQVHFPPLASNPRDWTPEGSFLIATYHPEREDHYFTERRMKNVRRLCPLTRGTPHPTLQILGVRMLSDQCHPWIPQLFDSPLIRLKRQIEWTQYILRKKTDLLRRVGLYDTIYLSLFSYGVDSGLMQAFLERWCYTTNTLLVQDREMTITLWELEQLCGLPIYGLPYDEHIVRSRDLFSDDYPDSLREIYRIYYKLKKDFDHVPFRVWISYFTDAVKHPMEGFASLTDPLGVGTIMLSDFTPGLPRSTICLQSMDDETFLTAFLSWWLSYFILPSIPSDVIRPSIFVMANAIARGHRVSLAIPTLANIYRGLRDMTSSQDPSCFTEGIPFHIISGWMHMHWADLYTPVAPQPLRDSLPLMIDLAGAVASFPTAISGRSHFCKSIEHLRDSRTRIATVCRSRISEKTIIDEVDLPQGEPGIRGRLVDMEYLISIRCGFLPLRLGGHIIMEPYSPQRVAHQFGFDQDVPFFLARPDGPDGLFINLPQFTRCWAALFRTRTGSSCCMVRLSRHASLSEAYYRWYRKLCSSFIDLPPHVIASITCPALKKGKKNLLLEPMKNKKRGRSSAKTAGPFIHLRVGPPDFYGLDDRFSIAGPASDTGMKYYLLIMFIFNIYLLVY